ncbi:DUF2946 domain-containing protein [Duganella sp. FT50W]|uniref:DUF2946 domain-containing protein n=1 Tax=Duganella lactea TaxID=2692173 RepID=A0A6L8MSG9_9BURK|nr:DUF2946 domain-containing protein [Duganella lactea]
MGHKFYRRVVWLALCGLIFAALSPAISKLLATSQGIEWTEICSAEGSKRIALDTTTKNVPNAPMAADSYCGYCVLQHYSPAIGTSSLSLTIAAASTVGALVGNEGRALFKRFVRDAHRTRAPPVVH